MSSLPPLVVAILHSDGDDVDYQLYCEAYGIEMQVDDEWKVEAVLLAPHDHISAVTENTDVTGEDAAIVSAGVTDVPLSDDGSLDLTTITDPKNNWLLVGDPRLNDADNTIVSKRDAALHGDGRVIICLTDTTPDHIAARLGGLGSVDCTRVVIALVHPNATRANTAATTAKAARDHVASTGASGNPRFIVAGEISADNVGDIVAIDGVDGVLLMDDKYSDFGTILEVLEALGG